MEPILLLKIIGITIGLFIVLKFSKFIIKLVFKVVIGAVLIYFACLLCGINLFEVLPI